MASGQNIHLSAEGIQGLLEGELPEREAAALQEHAASCARCRAELDAFRLLFQELDALSELAPSERFADEVIAALPPRRVTPRPEPAAARAMAWLRRRLPSAAPAPDHPGPERLQDFVEGLLSGRRSTGIAAHVAACAACEEEVLSWSRLFRGLDALPELAPSDGFAARVMAEVRVPEPERVRVPAVGAAVGIAPALAHLRERALEWAARMRPRTARGWAVTAGIAMSPGAAVAAVAWLIVAHPLLTFGNLAAFLWWQVTGALAALTGVLATRTVESVTAFQTWSAVEAVMTSPAAAALGFVTLASLMMVALWILYRNLILPTLVATHDARTRA